MSSVEYHLFLIWPKGRQWAERVVAAIQEDFTVLTATDLIWSRRHAFENLLRFYNNMPPIILWKALRCGISPVRMIVVRDDRAVYEERQTTAGKVVVNTHMFEAKSRYRAMTGGGHLIHGTNSPAEFRHDHTLLTGELWTDERLRALPVWDGCTVGTLRQDLAGAEGWRDLTEFFQVMNACTGYLVLRNFDGLPREYVLGTHGDIDFLCASRSEFIRVANARRASRLPGRVCYTIRVGGEKIPIDLRRVGDGYYDRNWQMAMLARRHFTPEGIPVPQPEELFYSLLYHALVHKYRLGADYQERLLQMAQTAGVAVAAEGTPEERLHAVLTPWLRAHGYEYTEPSDRTVHFNSRYTGRRPADWIRRLKVALFALIGRGRP